MQKGLTVQQATEQWVGEFDAIQQGMIQKLMEYEPDDWIEVTEISVGDRVYAYESEQEGEVFRVDCVEDRSQIIFDDGTEDWVCNDDLEIMFDDGLPMWSTMWSFHDSCDEDWLENMDGIRILSECGFRVYRSEEFGYFFGIDGAGYDFYEAHWIPLYRKRGLQWHDPETLQV